jgi:hypothetical protein
MTREHSVYIIVIIHGFDRMSFDPTGTLPTETFIASFFPLKLIYLLLFTITGQTTYHIIAHTDAQTPYIIPCRQPITL